MAFKSNIPDRNGTFLTTRNISAMKGTIYKDSKVIIVGASDRGYDIKDLESGEVITECGFTCIKPINT